MFSKCSLSALAVLALFTTPAIAQEATAPDAGAEAAAVAVAENAKDAVDATADAAKKTIADAAEKPAETSPADAATETGSANTATEAAGSEQAAETGAATDAAATKTDAAPASPAETSPSTTPEPAPAAEGPQTGQPYVYSEHSAWTINCVKLDQGADPCVLTQLLKDSTDNAVAEMSFVSLNSQNVAAGGTLVTPLETDLIRGIGIRIDGGETRGYPFSVCTAQDGCIARIGFTAQELQQFKRGANAVITVLPYGADPKSPINLTMSLSGFTAGFEELTKLNEASAKAAE